MTTDAAHSTHSILTARRGLGRAVAAVASTGLLVGMGAIGVSPALAATANDCTVDNTVTAPAGATAIQTLLTAEAPLICLSGTFTLAEPLTFDYDSVDLTLFGLPGGATLDGNRVTRILDGDDFATLTVHNLSVVNGSAPEGEGGGAIRTNGPVVLENSRFEGNTANGRGAGAVFIASDAGYGVDAQDSTFVGNSSGTYGGAIYAPGAVTSKRSVFSENVASEGGGAIFSGTGVSDASTFTNNTAADDGGAIYATDTVAIVNSTFVGNRATGATGEGGAVLARGGDISFSTFLNNTASAPIDGNDIPGEAIYLDAEEEFADLTVTANIFAGIGDRSQFGVGNLPPEPGDPSGMVDGGANVFSTASEPDLSVPSSTSVFSASVTQIFGTSPQLGNNGGPTQTVALVTGSPAIGIVPAGALALTTDQRGQLREGLRDAGAFEFQPSDAPAPAPTPTLPDTGSAPISGVLSGITALVVALGAALMVTARRRVS
jgi:predicted outer membrane repeat protein